MKVANRMNVLSCPRLLSRRMLADRFVITHWDDVMRGTITHISFHA